MESTAVPSIPAHRAAERPGSPGRSGQHTDVRRQPERGVLHQVVREHLETFLAEARLRGGGEGLPHFVERELRAFLTVA
ncbi:MAG: hypothetical protein ACRDUX_07530 [Mycobacterium sp.]